MPKVLSIEVSRFRGIREGKVRDLADVNVVVGRNNSGKSTVAEAICLLAHFTDGSKDVFGRDRAAQWADQRNQVAGFSPPCWYRADLSQPIQLSATTDAPGEASTLAVEISGAQSDPLFNVKKQSLPRPFLRSITAFFPSDFRWRFELILWGALLNSRKDKLLVAALRRVFGVDLEQLVWTPQGELMLAYPDHAVNLDLHGDGMRAALRCLMVIASLDGGFLVLEEPENHHHPESLRQFARAVCELARIQKVQLWINTHSVECVDAFLAAAKESEREAALYSFRLNDGLLDARRFSADAVEELQASGTDPRYLDLYG